MTSKSHDKNTKEVTMQVLVTGGAGFIGSNLVKELLTRGHAVRVLDNLLSGHSVNLAPFPDVEFVKGDIRNTELADAAVKGCEVVFHLAASVGNKRSIDLPIDDAEIT
jgi:UDP-glucose 4-epimerase